MGIKKEFWGSPLTVVSLGGFVFVLVLTLSLVFFTITRNLDVFPLKSGSIFLRNLRSYDEALAIEKPDLLDRRLDRLERQARNQEEWLSILKRRRNLAQINTGFLTQYQKSAQDALRKFPYSEIMVAVAGDSFVQDPHYEHR